MKLPFYNHTKSVLTLGIEPEGDGFDIPPGATCELLLHWPDYESMDLEIQVEDQFVTVFASCSKEVVVAGHKVR